MTLTTHEITVGLYLLMVFIAVALWFATAENHNKKLASVQNLLRQVLGSRATRVGITLFWWWLGVHFLYSHIHGK